MINFTTQKAVRSSSGRRWRGLHQQSSVVYENLLATLMNCAYDRYTLMVFTDNVLYARQWHTNDGVFDQLLLMNEENEKI